MAKSNTTVSSVNEYLDELDIQMGYKGNPEYDVQYSTGFLPFDYKNGSRVRVKTPNGEYVYDSCGLVDGSLYMVIGRSGCGKSTWVIQVAANIAKMFDKTKVFLDSLENGVMLERLVTISGMTRDEVQRKFRVRTAGITINNVYTRIKAIHDFKIANETDQKYRTGKYDSNGNEIIKYKPTIYIVDSIPYLTSDKLSQEEELSGQMSTTATAKQLAQFYRRIMQMCKEANIIFIAVNHIGEKVEANPMMHTKSATMYLKQNETLPGGVTPRYSSTIIRMDDGNKLVSEKDFGIDGCVVEVSNVKSRAGKSGDKSIARLVFNYMTGFDPDLSLYLMLKDAGRVNGTGAYLYLGDRSDMKFSQKNFKSKLMEDPEFMKVFVEQCRDEFVDILDTNEKMLAESMSTNATIMIITSILDYNMANIT